MPAEVRFGLTVEDNVVYFILTDPTWVKRFFRNAGDGIAVDVISKDQYVCNGENKFTNSSICRGVLIKPVYTDYINKNGKVIDGAFYLKIGEVPESMKGKEIETNLLILQDYYLCDYNVFYNLSSASWGLLDMGLYLDKLVYFSNKDTVETMYERIYKKEIEFVIPFLKGKTDCSPQDVKAIQDSLNNNNYEIKRISIRAYSSVEGTKSINIQLQEQRAKSIVDVLQSYQKTSIDMTIQASENWVEFFKDISTTKYASWASLSKEEIKQKLMDKAIALELEPILKKHRKAVLFIEFVKKNIYSNVSVDELLEKYKSSVQTKDLNRAMEIQTVLFDRYKEMDNADQYISNMELPKKIEYMGLWNSRQFLLLNRDGDVLTTLLGFQELSKMFPNEGRLKYNICVLKFSVWLNGLQNIVPEDLKKEIYELSKYGISMNLINRMLINYNIIRGALYMEAKDYINKDKCLTSIQTIYKNIKLNNEDLVSLAQYFSFYYKFDWAIQLLQNKINMVDVDEEVLFYYINLTISNPNMTQLKEYRSTLMNAYNINPQRFCKMVSAEGITFQLMDDVFIKKSYCENCKE